MILICITLILSGIEYLFMYLFGICVWFWEKKTVYSDILPIFNWVICVFFLCYWIIDFLIWSATNDLLDIWCANIFFHSVGWLFVSFCLFFSFLLETFQFYVDSLIVTFLLEILVSYPKNCHYSTISGYFPLRFFLDVFLQLNVLYLSIKSTLS